ncbi:hypothetical protein SLA2020_361800 [Shorea laevis]
MSNPTLRYQKLAINEALPRLFRYPIACKELSFILRGAYGKVPKNLQSLIFEDTLTAFRLLPQMQTGSAVAAAHLLFQSAEAALPKQKKNLAITEFKQAKIAHKRLSKAHQEEKEPSLLPQDVLLHIFSFLDLQSIVSAGQVCWSWNFAANDNQLWQMQYTILFGGCAGCSSSTTKMRLAGKPMKEYTHPPDNMITQTINDWREAFKRAYKGNSSKKLTSNRGYCGHCKTIVWHKNLRCPNRHCGQKYQNQQIKPVSSHQVVEYLLDEMSLVSSSDSDSESDEHSIPGLWAYPRNMSRCEK